MNRIDTINARENMFGAGKSGFHDNSDLPGQDATYVSPKWFNTVQEELCNILELRGIALDPEKNRQLYDLLTTQTDLEALADEIETNFIRKSQIVDNLTTNDANKVASAGTVKELNDRFINDFLNLKSENGYQKLPSGLIIQWGRFTPTMATTVGSPQYVSYPIAFPNKLLFAVTSTNGGATSGNELAHIDTSLSTKTQLGIYTNYNNSDCWYFAVGY